MTSEQRPSEFIEEFVNGGLKFYAYMRVNTTKGERKSIFQFRGITLNYNTSLLVNFEVMKDVILEETERGHITVHTEKQIKRNRRQKRRSF